MDKPVWRADVPRTRLVRGAYDTGLGWLSFLLFWVFVAAIVRDTHVGPPYVSPFDLWVFVPLLLAPVVGLLPLFRGRGEAEAVAGPEGLVLRARQWRTSLPRKQIVSAHVRPSPGGAEVELRLAGGSVLRLALPRESAEDLVYALGLDAEHRPATLTLGRVELRYARACLAALAHALVALFLTDKLPAFLGESLPFSLALVAVHALVSFLVVRATRNTEVTVGLDAVVVRGPFRRRVIPWSRIQDITHDLTSVTLHLTPPAGEDRAASVRLRLPGWSDQSSAAALATRLEEARALRSEVADENLGDKLARAGRPLKDWRASVASLLDGNALAYRSAAVRVETLRTLAASPSTPAEQRLAAALAIGSAGDRAARAAVRASAGSVVSRRLRIALREALKETPDEKAIEEALAEAESEPERARR